MGSHSMPIVSVRGVSKVYRPAPRIMRMFVRTTVYDDVVALDGVDLQLAAGQTLALVGPSGAGKTTLFRILTGLTTPTTGTAEVLGLDVDRQSLAVRRLVGFMPAEYRSLFMRMSSRTCCSIAGCSICRSWRAGSFSNNLAILGDPRSQSAETWESFDRIAPGSRESA